MAFVGEPPSESDPTSDPDLDFSQGPGLALTGRLGSSSDDAELDEPLPNGERLVAQAVEVAGADHATASLVGRFWRFAPDEELVGFTAPEMYDAAVAHRGPAAGRVPRGLKLAITPPTRSQGHNLLPIV